MLDPIISQHAQQLISQVLAISFLITSVCGLIGSFLPQHLRIAEILTKVGSFTPKATTQARADIRAIEASPVTKSPDIKSIANVSILGLACFACLFACMPKDIHVKIQQALIFEDQVQVQVANLRAVADTLIVMAPVDKQPEMKAKVAEAYAELEQLLDAKDTSLQAALVASADTVDVSATVQAVVSTVQKIIALVATFGASPLFVQQQQTKTLRLGGVIR